MQECQFRAMGCQMLAVVDSDDIPAATRLADVPGWFGEWEQQLSRFRADSSLSRLNAAAGQPCVVSPVLWEVLNVALEMAAQSDGLVQPTVLAALERVGYNRSFDEIVSNQVDMPQLAQLAQLMDWRTLKLNPTIRTVTLPTGTRLDLGGVAKGWAADQAARLLSTVGPALVDAGGDIAVSGPMADGEPWPIAIANPFVPEQSLGLLLLAHGAVATSGRDYRRWSTGGIEQHHIIDPRTGRPAQTDVLSATAVGPDGPTAEMAAKVALILGSKGGLAWLDKHTSVAGLLVLNNGRVLRSQRMDAYLEDIPVDAVSVMETAHTEEVIQ